MSNIEEIVSNIDKIDYSSIRELEKILYDIELEDYKNHLIEIEEGLLEDHPEEFPEVKTEEDKIKHIESSVDASLSSWEIKNKKRTPIERIISPCCDYDTDGDYIVNEYKLNNAIQELISQFLNYDKEQIISKLNKQNIDIVEIEKIEKLIDVCKQYLKK